MSRLNKILAPTDLSEVSKVGLRHALELARENSAELIVLHVIDFDMDWHRRRASQGPTRNLLMRTRQALDHFLATHFAECIDLVEVRPAIEFGTPHKSIVAKAESEAADLIVMSTHGRTGVDHLILGSVAEKVVARASCPVLVIPGRPHEAGVPKAA